MKKILSVLVLIAFVFAGSAFAADEAATTAPNASDVAVEKAAD